MVRFIPDVRPEDIAHDSERLVYQALRELPTGYVVLHSFPWLRPRRDLASEPLHEGEADFVVVHPDRGLLVLEVKGGSPELRQRTWFRSNKEMRDPFEQARRNRYALLDAIEERSAGRIQRGMFTHGDVVVFPHCRYEGPLPLNSDARILLDSSATKGIGARVEAAFEAWQRRPTRLTPSQLSALLDALMPKMRLMRCVSAELAAEGQRIIQVTQDQRATLRGLLASPRVLVEGSAGSGKTLLAVEFAVTLAMSGATVLLLCFNSHLAAWLQEQARADPRLRGASGSLEIATFHSYALTLARRARVEFAVPKDNTSQTFWDDEVPLILEQALDLLRTAGCAPLHDAVVVDEAQDFSPDWWVTVESLTRGARRGRLYAFLDLHQSLRGEPRLPTVPLEARFRLTTNCRNTRAIARSATGIIGAEVTLLPGTPEGEEPSLLRAPTAAAQGGLVLQQVRLLLRGGLDARQLVLIGPGPHENGSLGRFADVDGVCLVDDASDWRRGGGILVTTARSFKGLEADVVIAYDLGGFGTYFTPTDLYVAWTRARHRLICVCHGAGSRATIEAALAKGELLARDDCAQ